MIQRHKLISYLLQIHTPSKSAPLGGGPQFDGFIEFLVPDFDVFFTALDKDPEYNEKVKPDDDYLLDQSATVLVVAGYEEVCVQDGELTKLGEGK